MEEEEENETESDFEFYKEVEKQHEAKLAAKACSTLSDQLCITIPIISSYLFGQNIDTFSALSRPFLKSMKHIYILGLYED